MGQTGVARKLAAILLADVVGYSRLMGADEEGTLAALKAHRVERVDPNIADCNGHIVKLIGDGILAEFPSVVDAVRCAVAIQQDMAAFNAKAPAEGRIQFRIGVNLGDIIVEGGDIYGDGVNVTARLETLAHPGGICISGTVQEHVQGKLDVHFEDAGEHQVKNIDRPVRVYRIGPEGGDKQQPAAATPAPRKSYIGPVAAGFLTAAILVGLAVNFWPVSKPPPPPATVSVAEKPSIAVLPFTNMSDDKAQEYFSDGVTEDLITDLSRISGLFVIARNTVFTYKGRAVNVTEVSEELGVRYVLEGSVRRAGDQVRINAQLIDAQTGGHVWADRFDREMGDIFALQDDVTRQIVAALKPKLTPVDQARLKSTERETSAEVYDVYLRGVELLRQYTPESIIEARTYFLRALSLDPDYARAHAAMAFTYTASGIFFRSENADEAVAEALRYSRRAVELDETLPQSYFALAVALLREGRHDDSIAAARKSIEYDPNYADGYAALANTLLYIGDGPGAEAAMLESMRLNPRYSAAYIDILGRAYFLQGRHDEAIAQLDECIARDPNALTCRAFLAATYAASGQTEKAQWEAQEVLGLEPGLTLENDGIASQFRDPKDREHYANAMRLAGIPEK